MKHIDKLFQEKLYNHEVHVPEGMWEKIAPIAEEETGRAILWFWFAGIIALALGAYGLYNMMNNESAPVDPSTLVYEDQIQSNTNDQLVGNQFSMQNNTVENSFEASTAINDTEAINVDTEKNNTTEVVKPQSTTAQQTKKSKKVKAQLKSNQIISNTVETLPNFEGIPANLVITKSYINKEGSIIKQSSISDEANDEPVYDVIINSEAKNVNAGALLRIVEPLESITLPALNKELKKKNLTTIF